MIATAAIMLNAIFRPKHVKLVIDMFLATPVSQMLGIENGIVEIWIIQVISG